MRRTLLAKFGVLCTLSALSACSDNTGDTPAGGAASSSGGDSTNVAGDTARGGSATSGGRTNESGGATNSAGAGGGSQSAGTGGTAGSDASAGGNSAGAGGAEPRTPRKLLLADEGHTQVHFIDLDEFSNNWTAAGGGRDLQLIGNQRLLIAQNDGFAELDLAARGKSVRTVKVAGLPGVVEAARRLPNGNTVLAGNGGGGVFVWDIGTDGKPVATHQQSFAGVDKLRTFRLDQNAKFVFCSTIEGSNKRTVQQGDWEGKLISLFEFPQDNPAAHMFKVIQTGVSEVTVATGYGASIVRIDTNTKQVTKTIGGPSQPKPAGATRDLVPHFYAGFQILKNGDYLVTNWQDHGGGNNDKGYQLIQYDRDGKLIWFFDQAQYPQISSLHNVIAIDGLDTTKLNDDRSGPITPVN